VTLSFSLAPVIERPFPHVVVDDYLEPGLYRRLVGSFPECPPNSGPTGFTCFWGDPEYDQLLNEEPAWRTLFEIFHGQAFVDHCLAQFAEVFAAEAAIDLSRARYVPYQESRADKQRRQLERPVHAPDELWSRVDVLQGRGGYGRGRHLDHRRRAVSMLIYFSDADENGMVGGDLVLHGRGGARNPIRPRHNRMVAFPCHKESFHSVTPIEDQNAYRSFVQVTLSSSVDLWKRPVFDADESLASLRELGSRGKRWLMGSAA
jgi:hypothetical protein